MSAYLNSFYTSSFVWNFAHGMTHLLVPLYALHLDMSGFAIGSLVALPVILQLVFTLLGGIYVDRLGTKNVLYIACLSVCVASAVYLVAEGFAGLFVGQCLFVMARATYWTAAYSLGSELPGERSGNLGRLNSVTNAGQITGTAVAGMVIAHAGYFEGFLVSGGTALAALGLTALIGHARRPRHGPHPGMVATYRDLAAQRPMYFGMACAVLAVLPFTISATFHPILLVQEQYTSGQIGWLLSVRALGAIFAGIALAGWVRTTASSRVPIWSCAATGMGLAASALITNVWAMVLWLFVLGVSSGLVGLYFQVLISANSSVEQRGSAISYAGLGWNISNIAAPMLMGVLTDAIDIYWAFYLMGAVLLASAAALQPLYRWAFAPRPVPAR